MKNLITKLLNGESLTDEEKAKLQSFDLDKVTNDAAAAARRKAETQLETLKGQLEEMKSQSNGHASETDKLIKRIENLEKARQAAEAEAASLKRNASLEAIRSKAGIKFIDGVDPKLLTAAFAQAFDGVEDLDDETVTSEIIKSWSNVNRALIVDQSGHGTGQVSVPNPTPSAPNPYSQADFNLTQQIELERNNPTLAASLKASAQ